MKNTYQLILATDLDGTFLEGNSGIKNFFYSSLINFKEKVCLIYVTGRSIESVRNLCLEEELPMPHFIITDHGMNIAVGNTFSALKELQESITVGWDDKNLATHSFFWKYSQNLPKGINKGTSLLRLLEYIKIDPRMVITCGDSLNDLSLFQIGLKSIIVGNAEKTLLNEAKKLSNIYYSSYAGLLGILDGLNFYGKYNLFEGNFNFSA